MQLALCEVQCQPPLRKGCYPVAMEDVKRFVAPVVVLAVTFAVFAMSFARL